MKDTLKSAGVTERREGNTRIFSNKGASNQSARVKRGDIDRREGDAHRAEMTVKNLRDTSSSLSAYLLASKHIGQRYDNVAESGGRLTQQDIDRERTVRKKKK